MIRKELLPIISNKKIAHESYELILESENISSSAVPGQFLHLSIRNHTLRRPLSIAAVDKKNHTVTLLYKLVGTGTEDLITYDKNEKIDVLGPGGKGFVIEDLNENDKVLLIGGGIGVPPLHFLAQKLSEKNVKMTMVLGFLSKEYMFYEKEFNELGHTIIATDDGSYGEKGRVTDVDLSQHDFKHYYSCGPLPMLKAVKEKYEHIDGFLSFEERFGCGVGACFACVIPTKDEAGYKKICQDGPVFSSKEVLI